MDLDPVDVVLMALRIAECSGKPFMYMERLMRETKRISMRYLKKNSYSTKDFRRSIDLNKEYFRPWGTTLNNLRIRLSVEGVRRADELLGTIRSPQRVNIIKKNPYTISLETLYIFQNIGLKTHCRHYYYIDVLFINDELEFIDDPRDATDVTGLIRLLTRGRKEEIYINELDSEIISDRPRIALLLQFALHKFDALARADRILAESLVGICAIKKLFGCKIENRTIIWREKTIF